MQKVFMLINYTPNDKSIGITKKIEAEIDTFKELNWDVYYSAYIDGGIGIFDNNNQLIFSKRFIVKNRKYQSLRRYFLLINTCQLFFDATDVKFDLCFGRLLAPNHAYIKLLTTMKKSGMRIIIESLAYFPGIKFKSMKGKYITYMLKKNSKKFKYCVDRFLTEGHLDDFYGVPTKEARIGVAVDKIVPHHYLGNTDEINLISVSNETQYHAYDRIIKSIACYRKHAGSHKIKLHLVGTIHESTRKLIKELQIEDLVLIYGKRYGKELDDIYNQCNMGIGPLGPHRIGGKKDTGLKTKEYFAKGLPYIYAGTEMKVLDGFPFIHEVPSDESLISIDEIWKFYETYANSENVVQEMRKFAKRELSWMAIIKEAIDE